MLADCAEDAFIAVCENANALAKIHRADGSKEQNHGRGWTFSIY